MDPETESTISNAGLVVMANPDAYVSEEQINRLRTAKLKREEYLKLRKVRQMQCMQKKQTRETIKRTMAEGNIPLSTLDIASISSRIGGNITPDHRRRHSVEGPQTARAMYGHGASYLDMDNSAYRGPHGHGAPPRPSSSDHVFASTTRNDDGNTSNILPEGGFADTSRHERSRQATPRSGLQRLRDSRSATPRRVDSKDSRSATPRMAGLRNSRDSRSATPHMMMMDVRDSRSATPRMIPPEPLRSATPRADMLRPARSRSRSATPRRSLHGDVEPSQLEEIIRQVVRATLSETLATRDRAEDDGRASEYKQYVEDDLEFRIRQMINSGKVNPSPGFDINSSSTRRKEIEHWRMKLTLEEKELDNNCSTFIAVGADVLEGFCDAIGFHTFETKELSLQVEESLEAGRFSNCIKQYANMGGGQFMKNPLLNFVTTFTSIMLKNHLQQKKKHLVESMNPATSLPSKRRPKSRISASRARMTNHISNPPVITSPVASGRSSESDTGVASPCASESESECKHIETQSSSMVARAKFTAIPNSDAFDKLSGTIGKITPALKKMTQSMNFKSDIQSAKAIIDDSLPSPMK